MRQESINTIRRKLQKLKKEAHYPYRDEYRYGYHQAITDALKEIRKIVLQKKKWEKENTLKEFRY